MVRYGRVWNYLNDISKSTSYCTNTVKNPDFWTVPLFRKGYPSEIHWQLPASFNKYSVGGETIEQNILYI